MGGFDGIRGHLQAVLDTVREETRTCEYYKGQYEAVYRDVARLGEVLGYPICARPETPVVLMDRWITEVEALVKKYSRRGVRIKEEKKA